KAGRSNVEAPGRVELATLRHQPLEQRPVEVEDVDIAVARPRHVIMPGGILKRVSHEQMAIEHLSAERRVARRHAGIREAPDQVEAAVELLDESVAEVGRVEEIAAGGRGDRQSLVDSAAAEIG